MLQRHHERAFQNLSIELEESQQWKPNELTRLYFPKDYTAFEYEPVTGLLAIGTMQLYPSATSVPILLCSQRHCKRIHPHIRKTGSPRIIGTWK